MNAGEVVEIREGKRWVNHHRVAATTESGKLYVENTYCLDREGLLPARNVQLLPPDQVRHAH